VYLTIFYHKNADCNSLFENLDKTIDNCVYTVYTEYIQYTLQRYQ